MKYTPIIILSSLLLASCGATTIEGDVAGHRAVRDSLKNVREELNIRIAKEEAWLGKNDPDVQRNLPVVTVFYLAPSEFAHYTEAHGSVKATNNALLYTTSGGEVRRILVQQGQKVQKGQKIVDIDTDVISSNILAAETNAKLAKDIFERQEKLWGQKIGSEVQFLEAKTRKEAADAQLASARNQYQSAQIIAPFDGMVDEVFPNVGDMTTPMQPVARVVSLGKASIETDLSEDMLGKVALNDPVVVVLPETSDTVPAVIDQIGQYINPNNRTFKITLRVTTNVELRPNQLANVRIRDMDQSNALVVPSRLVMENSEGKSYVYILQKGEGDPRAKKMFVDVVMAQAGEFLIETKEGGLKGGEQLIDQGSRLVVDKQEVKVM